jgi:hypothetical protein
VEFDILLGEKIEKKLVSKSLLWLFDLAFIGTMKIFILGVSLIVQVMGAHFILQGIVNYNCIVDVSILELRLWDRW